MNEIKAQRAAMRDGRDVERRQAAERMRAMPDDNDVQRFLRRMVLRRLDEASGPAAPAEGALRGAATANHEMEAEVPQADPQPLASAWHDQQETAGDDGETGEGDSRREGGLPTMEPLAVTLAPPVPLPLSPFSLFGAVPPAAVPESRSGTLAELINRVADCALLAQQAGDGVLVRVREEVLSGVQLRIARSGGEWLVDLAVTSSASFGILQAAGEKAAATLAQRLRSDVQLRLLPVGSDAAQHDELLYRASAGRREQDGDQ